MYKIYMQAAFNVPNRLANSSLWDTDRQEDGQTDRQTHSADRQSRAAKFLAKSINFYAWQRTITHPYSHSFSTVPEPATSVHVQCPVSIQHCNFFCLSAHNQVSISICCLKIFSRNYAKALRIPQNQRTVLVKSCQRLDSPWRVSTEGSTRNYTV